MRKMKKNCGQTAVEYLIMLGVVTAVSLTAFPSLMTRSYNAAAAYYGAYANLIANQGAVDK